MDTLAATPLESALLEEFHRLYGDDGFPALSEIAILERENTGAGRFVKLRGKTYRGLSKGHLDLGGKFIEMEGIPNGMMAVILVRDGNLVELELAVYRTDSWSGEEHPWSLR